MVSEVSAKHLSFHIARYILCRTLLLTRTFLTSSCTDAGLLGAVYLATFLISNVVTNNAAAALIFPIAMDAAEQTGTDRLIMSYCVMLSASASFMSPYGYTTNLLIYGPGGYKVSEGCVTTYDFTGFVELLSHVKNPFLVDNSTKTFF